MGGVRPQRRPSGGSGCSGKGLNPLHAAAVPLLALLVASTAAAGPTLGVLDFAGREGPAVSSELALAFREVGGLTVLEPPETARRIDGAGRTPRGWKKRPAEVRRVLSQIQVDLLVTGKVYREGGREIVVVFLHDATTGKVVSAARVERDPAGFPATARRMAQRLKDLAFASKGIEAPKLEEAPKVATVPKPAPAPAPSLAALPPAPSEPQPAPSPQPPTPPIKAEPQRRLLEVEAGAAFAHLSRAGVSSAGLVGVLGLRVHPAARAEGWIRDLGLHLDFEVSAAFQEYEQELSRSTPSLLRVRPMVGYRFLVDRHEIWVSAGYEFRDLQGRVRKGGVEYGRLQEHLLAVGSGAAIRLGGSPWWFAPSLRLWPVSSYEGRLGLGGGLAVYLELSGASLGLTYRLEWFGAPGSLTASDFNDTVHTLGLVAGYRY